MTRADEIREAAQAETDHNPALAIPNYRKGETARRALALIPPGSVILTPDEVATVRAALDLAFPYSHGTWWQASIPTIQRARHAINAAQAVLAQADDA